MRVTRSPYWWKKSVQHQLMRLTGDRLLPFEDPRHGMVDTNDLSRAGGEINTIVDVGAHTGQSAIRFRVAFPDARIISVEPIRSTFAELQRRTADLNVECFRLALGPANGMATMYLTPVSNTNSLVRPTDEECQGTEEVEVQTFDDFAAAIDIDTIDLLKIDAEGFDLEVLHGAHATLAARRVRFVLIEVGFHPGDDRHPLFDDVRATLMEHGFRVFGIYAQTLEWTGEPAMRFANALFCRQGP